MRQNLRPDFGRSGPRRAGLASGGPAAKPVGHGKVPDRARWASGNVPLQTDDSPPVLAPAPIRSKTVDDGSTRRAGSRGANSPDDGSLPLSVGPTGTRRPIPW